MQAPLESPSASVLQILTYDERKLSPSFGYFFDAHWLAPYESIVGILWKFARYEEQQRQRNIAALQRRAHALGFQINPLAAAA